MRDIEPRFSLRKPGFFVPHMWFVLRVRYEGEKNNFLEEVAFVQKLDGSIAAMPSCPNLPKHSAAPVPG